MNVAFLCLGGNMGDRLANLSRAKELISEEWLTIVAESYIYETSAWGSENSPDYYNQCIKITTASDAQSLMKLLLDIEQRLGRIRTENRNESRTVDIDILLFNNEVINTPFLIVPHPRMHLRQFVLKPLNEIAGDIIHPVLKKNIRQLVMDCPDQLTVKKLGSDVYMH
jgi:2-amino-4-hydroxy-6-hydroxymethyldihydropteridine diphosphokinase